MQPQLPRNQSLGVTSKSMHGSASGSPTARNFTSSAGCCSPPPPPRLHIVKVPCVSLRTPCLIADDQVAVVPREWSLEYFAHCAAHPGPSEEVKQTLDTRAGMPPRWPDDGSPPVEAIYRHWGDAVECEACMACNSSKKMQNTRCAEPRLTARLLALRVPLAVAAFRQRLLPALTPGAPDPLDSGSLVDHWLAEGEQPFDLWHGVPKHYAWSC